jgi:hypothetical protein
MIDENTNLDGHDKTRLACVAIGAIVFLEAIALSLGHDGLILSASIGMIAAITGGLLGFKIGVEKSV